MSSLRANVYRVAAASPDDISGVQTLIDSGLDPKTIVAVFGKTEGNGCVNDFTRGFATTTFERMFDAYGVNDVSIVMSGGTEGALSPHWTIFTREEVDAPPTRALAVGVARTAVMPPENLGRKVQVALVAEGVRAAMRHAGIEDPSGVHFVQIKCPLLTSARIGEAATRGNTTVVSDTLKSMGFSRGASALGIAVALNEISIEAIGEEDICQNLNLYSSRASTSAGVELTDHEIVVIGTAEGWSGPLAVDHAVMRDCIDISGIKQAMERLPEGDMVAVLAKAEASTSGHVRGARHTMLDDSDISSTRHARGFVGGVLAGFFQDTMLYVSGGAEHQGPAGGGPVAIIVKRKEGLPL
ncbi:ring-opening amidohydrolase [Agrobacterium larrymoorei]|uniref:cyanuric acid amidohydrolase n=1 Tax=Agrobacterium larrymoorei TaxID=160699 RepID=UPI0015727118|nr:ring-opening amidohydrolase [Agrobacterium larrymoorei]NTJ43820.1 ring-opening amidohydrolase [Agrobacterium larrymoorei]